MAKLVSPIVDEEDEKEGQPLILIAEDNKEINEYLLETLQSENFKVISAMNGAKAWELAEKKIPDLVITDVLMPKMGGLELCGKLKNEPLTSHIPVIMLTAKTDDQSKIEGLEIGADDYLSKPFLPKELLIKIKNILKNRKILQEKFQGEQLNPVEVISINKYDRELFQKINKVIEANIKNPALSVEFIGDQIGMSREHLFRKLKAIAGTSPSEFIRSYRLNRAAQLLVEQQLTVADAADEVGYNDVQYFSKSFRKKFNCSPNQYAKKN
ncbi:MAG: response regulator [Pedobacter sp.]|nr:MAG: response regulator [Pedobacter sp.]